LPDRKMVQLALSSCNNCSGCYGFAMTLPFKILAKCVFLRKYNRFLQGRLWL